MAVSVQAERRGLPRPRVRLVVWKSLVLHCVLRFYPLLSQISSIARRRGHGGQIHASPEQCALSGPAEGPRGPEYVSYRRPDAPYARVCRVVCGPHRELLRACFRHWFPTFFLFALYKASLRGSQGGIVRAPKAALDLKKSVVLHTQACCHEPRSGSGGMP